MKKENLMKIKGEVNVQDGESVEIDFGFLNNEISENQEPDAQFPDQDQHILDFAHHNEDQDDDSDQSKFLSKESCQVTFEKLEK